MKLSRIILVVALGLSSTLNAQERSVLKTKKSHDLVNITGTDISVKLPFGFHKSLTFTGWSDSNESMIVVSRFQLPVDNVLSELRRISDESGFSSTHEGRRSYSLNGMDAEYLETSGENKLKRYLLVRTEGYTYVIEARSSADPLISGEIEKALLSTFIEN
jgi:hypothetical protein